MSNSSKMLLASMGSIFHPSSFPFSLRRYYLVHLIVMDHQLLVLQSYDSSPVPFESKDGSLHPAPQAIVQLDLQLFVVRWRWNRSLGWYRSMTWILTRNTSRRNSKNWVIQRYPIRSCHPRRIPQRKSWRCQSTSNIRHPSWRALQSRRCCTCRLNWGRRPKRNWR